MRSFFPRKKFALSLEEEFENLFRNSKVGEACIVRLTSNFLFVSNEILSAIQKAHEKKSIFLTKLKDGSITTYQVMILQHTKDDFFKYFSPAMDTQSAPFERLLMSCEVGSPQDKTRWQGRIFQLAVLSDEAVTSKSTSPMDDQVKSDTGKKAHSEPTATMNPTKPAHETASMKAPLSKEMEPKEKVPPLPKLKADVRVNEVSFVKPTTSSQRVRTEYPMSQGPSLITDPRFTSQSQSTFHGSYFPFSLLNNLADPLY